MVKNKLTAYHGTVESKAKKIISGKYFIKSSKETEWLGSGVYFFPRISNAIWWSKKASERFRDFPAVLSVQLCYFDYQILDLDRSNDLCKLSHCVQDFLEKLKEEGEIIPQFSDSQLPEWYCFSCNVYKNKHPNIKLMAYTFETPQETYTGFRYKQRQLCSTDNSIIVNICKEVIDDGAKF